MVKGKIRAEAHLIDQKAINIIKNKLPVEWVVRELNPDYGLDLEAELFQKEDDRVVTLGERMYIQVKGSTRLQHKEPEINTGYTRTFENCIQFSVDTALLRLVERVGDSLPIVLAVVDISSEEIFWVSLNDYVSFVLYDDESWRSQKTKSLYLSYYNDKDLHKMLRWYAIRPKLNSFFAEAGSLAIDVEYAATPQEYIKIAKRFALKYVDSDVWSCNSIGFGFLDYVHELIECLCNQSDCVESNMMFSRFSEDDCIACGNYNNMPIDVAKQQFVSQRMIQELQNANSIFATYAKRVFLMTVHGEEKTVNKH